MAKLCDLGQIKMPGFARWELGLMNIEADQLAMIRSKDGVTVWQVSCLERSYILKCFAKVTYRREILNV